MQLDISCDESLDIFQCAGGDVDTAFRQLGLELGIVRQSFEDAFVGRQKRRWRYGEGVAISGCPELQNI